MDPGVNHGDDGMIKSTHSVATTILDTPPSCLEFSPVTPEYFVVGTYHLERNESGAVESRPESEDERSVVAKQHRSGSLLIFRLQEDCV